MEGDDYKLEVMGFYVEERPEALSFHIEGMPKTNLHMCGVDPQVLTCDPQVVTMTHRPDK